MIRDYTIQGFDAEKRKLRTLITMFNLYVRKSKRDVIHDQLQYSGNPVVQVLHKIATDNIKELSQHTRMTGRDVDDRYQKQLFGMLEFILNIYNVDTAYGDIVDSMMLDLFQPSNAEKILTYLETYQPDIKRCYFNIWEKFKQETLEKEKAGVLQRGQLSENEQLYVTDVIDAKVKRTKKELGIK